METVTHIQQVWQWVSDTLYSLSVTDMTAGQWYSTYWVFVTELHDATHWAFVSELPRRYLLSLRFRVAAPLPTELPCGAVTSASKSENFIPCFSCAQIVMGEQNDTGEYPSFWVCLRPLLSCPKTHCPELAPVEVHSSPSDARSQQQTYVCLRGRCLSQQCPESGDEYRFLQPAGRAPSPVGLRFRKLRLGRRNIYIYTCIYCWCQESPKIYAWDDGSRLSSAQKAVMNKISSACRQGTCPTGI